MTKQELLTKYSGVTNTELAEARESGAFNGRPEEVIEVKKEEITEPETIKNKSFRKVSRKIKSLIPGYMAKKKNKSKHRHA